VIGISILKYTDQIIAVATVCGIIFGPVGAKLFDPNSWGNVDQITLECSRIVLVVQCFAVGVELPKVGALSCA
jgi:NhaP-type Na+/H+ or K+/H+ antiporter